MVDCSLHTRQQLSSATAFTFEALPHALDDISITLPAAAPRLLLYHLYFLLAYIRCCIRIHPCQRKVALYVGGICREGYILVGTCQAGVMDAAATGAPFTGIHRVALLPHAL
ncbi:MAG: hypothetical protein R2829_05305 [Bacteroidia bacterium]